MQAGVPMTGRKATAGSVYSFSLSWHPEQDPDREMMEGSALQVLEELGLYEHEAVIVAHNDTDHDHVHVICNLVHPETGKTAVPSYDYLTHSRWAEHREKQDGKIYCEQRVINNAIRKNKNREQRIVKHREQKLAIAQQVQNLYHNSDSGKAFQAAMNEAGYALAQGDRRGFVLVDNQGKVHSLSRQLKGVRAKDMRKRLNDLETLPLVKDVQQQKLQQAILEEQKNSLSRKFEDGRRRVRPVEPEPQPQVQPKPKQELQNSKDKPAEPRHDLSKAAELRPELGKKQQVKHNPSKDEQWQQMLERITKIAQDSKATSRKIEKPEPKPPTPEPQQQTGQQAEQEETPRHEIQPKPADNKPTHDEHLQRLDALREWERKMNTERERMEQQQRETYKLDELRQQIKEQQKKLDKAKNWWSRITGKRQRIEDDLHALQQTFNNANQRIEEQNAAFVRRARESKPGFEQDHQPDKNQEPTLEQQRQKALEQLRKPQRPGYNRGRGSPGL